MIKYLMKKKKLKLAVIFFDLFYAKYIVYSIIFVFVKLCLKLFNIGLNWYFIYKYLKYIFKVFQYKK